MRRFHQLKGLVLLLFFMAFAVNAAYANVDAIDFTLIKYPAALQPKIDFLKQNVGLYNHWSPKWQSDMPKNEVVDTLTALYNGLIKIANPNTETYLLLGDVAHFLYNLDVEEYYSKAVGNYQHAAKLSPDDYRVYWFLANHYALSAQPMLAMETYQVASRHLPARPGFLFWSDYSAACGLAGMLNTANFAAHQASLAEGKESVAEQQITTVIKHTLVTPPVDTTMQDKDVWAVTGHSGRNLIFKNMMMGLEFQVDSNWNLQLSGYQKHISYAVVTPPQATTGTGEKVGYTFLVLVKVPAPGETLQQFLDTFSGESQNKQKIITGINKIYGGLAYEMRDSSIYKDCGGSHGYAIAIERDVPKYPGMKLEAPLEMPKNNAGKVNYYVMQQKYTRLNSKLYYFILMDSCEHIHNQSTAIFNNFLKNLLIE